MSLKLLSNVVFEILFLFADSREKLRLAFVDLSFYPFYSYFENGSIVLYLKICTIIKY